MINNFHEYFLIVVISILDIGILYYLVHNISSPRNKWLSVKDQRKRPSLNLKVISFGIVYGIIIGYFGYLFAEEILFRAIGIILLWSIIKFMTNETWGNVIIIYTITFLSLTAIQTITILPMQTLGMPIVYMALISQFIGFVVCIVLYKSISLYKVFIFIKNKFLWIHFAILTPFIILMSVAIYYFSSRAEELFILLILIIISLTIIMGGYITIQYVKKLGVKFHHMESLLEGLDYLVKTINDPEEIQRHYVDTLKRIEFEIPENDFQPDNHEANIIEFIDNKRISRQAKMQIVKNIKFYWRNRNVSLPMMIYMLGTLLDNAFDTKTKKPLFVDIVVAAHKLEIAVSNASDKKSPIEIAQMFDEGATTKKGNHGYGLPNLSRIVKSYNGDIAVNCDYRKEYKCHYLTLTVRIKEFN